MKVLVVGSGGREHAIVQSLSSSPLCTRIYAARGNAGMKGAERIDIPETDVEGLASFAVREGIGLTVVGPELPLSLGIVNVFRERGLNISTDPRGSADRDEQGVCERIDGQVRDPDGFLPRC